MFRTLISYQLQSLTKFIPLPKLSSNSTLTIRSPSPHIPIHVHLIPQWRDDGQLFLEQTFHNNNNNNNNNNKLVGNNSHNSDASNDYSNKELDLYIETTLPNTTNTTDNGGTTLHSTTVPHITVLVDYKREELLQHNNTLKPSTTTTINDSSPLSSSHSSDTSSSNSNNRHHGNININFHYDENDSTKKKNIMTDDGILHHIPPQLNNMEDGVNARFVPYNDGIIHYTTSDNTHPSSSSITSSSSTTTSLDKQQNSNNIQQNNNTNNTKMILKAHIPEKCNVNCQLTSPYSKIIMNSGTKKLEGEEGFHFVAGDISVKKLRGNSITLLQSSSTSSTDTTVVGSSTLLPTLKSKGNIHADVLESQNLFIHTQNGGRVRVQKMNVSNATIEVEDNIMIQEQFEKLDNDDGLALIDISSLYTTQQGDGAHLHVYPNNINNNNNNNNNNLYPKKVRVKSSHGHLSVRTTCFPSSNVSSLHKDLLVNEIPTTATVELGGVNGSFDISMEQMDTNDQENKNNNNDETNIHNSWNKKTNNNGKNLLAASIHVDSLSPKQMNIVTCDYGDVNISFDRKVESDMRLLSTPFIDNFDIELLLDDVDGNDNERRITEALTKYDNEIVQKLSTIGSKTQSSHSPHHSDECDDISIRTNSFDTIQALDLKSLKYMKGIIENKSEEPNSRFDVKTKGLGSVGKIRIDSAAAQALDTFSHGGGSSNNSRNNENLKQDEKNRPLTVITTNGSIVVESLSWLGAIARRYGFSDDSGPSLGRQAKLSDRVRK